MISTITEENINNLNMSNAAKVRAKQTLRIGNKAVQEIEDALNGKFGDNSGGERLKSFIDRIERLEEEKAALSEDIKEIFVELKRAGFDKKTVKKLVKLRRIDEQKRREDQELLDLYAAAIGFQFALAV